MTEIALMGTIHFPDRFSIFSEETQKEIQNICNCITAWKPDKIAVEMSANEQPAIDFFYRPFETFKRFY